MKNTKLIEAGVGLTMFWGLASLGAQIAEAITPKGAKFMRKLGVTVGIGTIGAYCVGIANNAINKSISEKPEEDDVDDE